jgi:molecular chaperone GrpE
MTGKKESTNVKINVEEDEKDIPGQAVDEPGDGDVDAATDEPGVSLEEKYEAAVEESKQTYDRFLRLSAEFENFKKRKNREMADFHKFANESLIKDLLPMVDNIERAIESAKQDDGATGTLIEGVEMVLGETLKTLDKFKVKPIDSLHKPFDPCFHQAVFREESDQHPENTVINEVQKGYMLHDRLLRPAMVVVSQPKISADNDDN